MNPPLTNDPKTDRPLSAVHAVVVTHECGEKVKATLEALLAEVSSLTVIDNVSRDETLACLTDFAVAKEERITVIPHTINNLAAAQNIGIRRALEAEFGWVLLMDHDSIPEPGMVAAMFSALAAYPEPSRIGMLVPKLVDRRSVREIRYLRRGRFLFRRSGFAGRNVLDDVMVAIASGSLVRREVFERIGLMDEDFGIDDVDRDFSLRLVKAGYRILAVRDAVLSHTIGESRDHAIGPLHVTTTNHSARRRYTIYRNRMRCWRRHGRDFPGFVLFDAGAILYDLARMLFLENDKSGKLRAAFRGVRDGLILPAHSTQAGPPTVDIP